MQPARHDLSVYRGDDVVVIFRLWNEINGVREPANVPGGTTFELQAGRLPTKTTTNGALVLSTDDGETVLRWNVTPEESEAILAGRISTYELVCISSERGRRTYLTGYVTGRDRPLGGEGDGLVDVIVRNGNILVDLTLVLFGGASRYIASNVAFEVGPGSRFPQPADLFDYLSQFIIAPGARVTWTPAPGVYQNCRRVVGHPQGRRIRMVSPGLNGAPFVPGGANPIQPGDLQITPFTAGATADQRRASLAADKLVNENAVRARYKVIFEFSNEVAALACDGGDIGNWGPCLIINTGIGEYGVITGEGLEGAVGSGVSGKASLTGVTIYGFGSGGTADYGGIINCHQCSFLFCDDYGLRPDFGGGFYGADILIVGATYCYRGNHGGFIYGDRLKVRNAVETGVGNDNSASVARIHYCDIQGCGNTGLSAAWGGSAKAYGGTIKNNLRTQVYVGEDGTIDARGTDQASTISPAPTYGSRVFGSGFIDVSASGLIPGSGTVYPTTITGHGSDIEVDGGGTIKASNFAATSENGTAMAAACTVGTIKASGQTTTRDGYNYVRAAPFIPGARPASATIQVSGTTLDLGAAPVAKVINITSGTPGATVTITVITATGLDVGETLILWAGNASSGETVTLTDSSTLPLGADRVLDNIRDSIAMVKVNTTGAGLREIAFANNQ